MHERKSEFHTVSLSQSKSVLVADRRRTVWAAVQEQSLQTDLGGLPGDGGPLCGLLPDLPQHSGRCPRGLQQQHGAEPVPDAQVTRQPPHRVTQTFPQWL